MTAAKRLTDKENYDTMDGMYTKKNKNPRVMAY